jgi:hypothetical protein
MRSDYVILQSTSADYACLGELTYPTVDRYAEEYGIDVVRYRTGGDLFTVCKTKIKNMIGLLGMGYSHVLWIDTDAYIQTHQPLSFPEGDLFIAKDINGINAGVMAVSQGALPMLRRVLEMEMTAPWYEQGLIATQLDTCNVVYMPQRDFNAYFYELYGLQWDEGQVHDGSFIVHLPGLTNAERISVLQQKRDL